MVLAPHVARSFSPRSEALWIFEARAKSYALRPALRGFVALRVSAGIEDPISSAL